MEHTDDLLKTLPSVRFVLLVCQGELFAISTGQDERQHLLGVRLDGHVAASVTDSIRWGAIKAPSSA